MKKVAVVLLFVFLVGSLFANVAGLGELRKLFSVYKKGAVAAIGELKLVTQKKGLFQVDKKYRDVYNRFMSGLLGLLQHYPDLINGTGQKRSAEYKQIALELVMLGKRYKKARLLAAKRLFSASPK